MKTLHGCFDPAVVRITQLKYGFSFANKVDLALQTAMGVDIPIPPVLPQLTIVNRCTYEISPVAISKGFSVNALTPGIDRFLATLWLKDLK